MQWRTQVGKIYSIFLINLWEKLKIWKNFGHHEVEELFNECWTRTTSLSLFWSSGYEQKTNRTVEKEMDAPVSEHKVSWNHYWNWGCFPKTETEQAGVAMSLNAWCSVWTLVGTLTNLSEVLHCFNSPCTANSWLELQLVLGNLLPNPL